MTWCTRAQRDDGGGNERATEKRMSPKTKVNVTLKINWME